MSELPTMPYTFVQFGDTRVNLSIVICYSPCDVNHVMPQQEGQPELTAEQLRRRVPGIKLETSTGPVAIKFANKENRDAALGALDRATAPEILFNADKPERPSYVSNDPN